MVDDFLLKFFTVAAVCFFMLVSLIDCYQLGDLLARILGKLNL